ncbi:MAG: hypothetical protein GY699_17710 [Desulfobacteraceae bacterium]|nr:hypothetical protein [Desulfobacteraceae bacterium]
MLKKFAITLIVISTSVYGTTFFIAKHHGTSFFDEIVIQLNRLSTNLSNEQEVERSRFILRSIVENEQPPANWDNLIVHNQKTNHKELFYYYKIWTIKTKLSIADINDSYPIFKKEEKTLIRINMRYGKDKPILQFPFSKNKEGSVITGLFFPINERPLSADLNKDNKINNEDVKLARKVKN